MRWVVRKNLGGGGVLYNRNTENGIAHAPVELFTLYNSMQVGACGIIMY
jgi:hypothetical protein